VDIILPAGYPCGVRVTGGDQELGVVRLADSYVELPLAAYEVWGSYFGPDHQAPDGSSPGTDLPHVSELAADDLLVRSTGRLDTDRHLLEKYRLQPVVFGLGSTRKGDSHLAVGTLTTGPTVHVDSVTYALLMRSFLAPSMWELCARSAAAFDTQPDDLARYVLAALGPLLSTASAFLDLAL
jgi:hypothetical protein